MVELEDLSGSTDGTPSLGVSGIGDYNLNLLLINFRGSGYGWLIMLPLNIFYQKEMS